MSDDDVLAKRSAKDVADWYRRLADMIDKKKINNENPLAPYCLRAWLDNAETKADNVVYRWPPKHLRENSDVLSVIRYHRKVYLTEEKAKIGTDTKWAGIIPRLQGKKGFQKWDGAGTLDMTYQSLVEISLLKQFTGSDGEKDLLYALHGFQLHTEVTVKLLPAKSASEKTVVFEKFEAYVEDVYDWDPSKHISVPNPDYQSTSPSAIAPTSETIVVYHSNAKRIEREGFAKPYTFFTVNWKVTDQEAIGNAVINLNKSL